MFLKSVQVVTLVFIGAIASAATGTQQQPKGTAGGVTAAHAAMKPVASVKDVMLSITIPTSESVFSAASEPPKDTDGWDHIRKQAIALAESANLLLMDGRGPGGADWVTFAVAQRDATVLALKAIDAKDGDALSNASDALYETCDNCHKKFMKK